MNSIDDGPASRPASAPKPFHPFVHPEILRAAHGDDRPWGRRLGSAPRRHLAWMLGALVAVAVLHALYFARGFFLPLAMAVLFAGVLRPLVQQLARWRLPRTLAAALVVLATLAAVGGAASYLVGPAAAWVQHAPDAFSRFELKLSTIKAPLEQLTQATDRVAHLARPSGRVEAAAQAPGLDLLGLTQALAVDVIIVLILLFFLLGSGDFFFRELVGLVPPAARARAVACATRIERQISVYLFTVTAINFCLGGVASFALWLLGVPNAVLWGAMLGAATFIPYLGPVVAIAVIAGVSLITLDDVPRALVAPLVCAVLSATEGYLVTPLVVGKSLALNPVVIFVALTFWTWMWGIPGAIIAVPLLMVTKIVCDHVPALTRVGRLLGDYEGTPGAST